jgi:hypothetical protein
MLLHNAENTETRLSENGICLTQQMCHKIKLFRRGPLYRSTGQNINGQNINELQINCSIGQQKPVDV